MTGLLDPKIVAIAILVCNIIRCIFMLWGCSSGKVLIFLQDQFLGEVWSSPSEGSLRQVVQLFRSMRLGWQKKRAKMGFEEILKTCLTTEAYISFSHYQIIYI